VTTFLLLSLTLVAVVAAPAACQEPADPFAACEAHFTEQPDDWKACGCFYYEARTTGRRQEAAERLAGHLRHEPDNPCLLFYLGSVRAELGEPGSDELLRRAAEGYAERDEITGELYARINLSRRWRAQGRRQDAWVQFDRALEAAQRAGGEMLLTLELERVRLLREDGEDLERLDLLLRDLEPRVLAEGRDDQKRELLLALAQLRYHLGRWDEAESYQRRLLALAESTGDLYTQATARLNLALIHLARPPRRGCRERGVELVREALEAARAAGQLGATAEAQMRLGRLLKGPEARGHLEAAVAAARRAGDPELLASALRTLAAETVEADPEGALRRMGEAEALSQAADSPWAAIYGWADRWRVAWATQPRDEALAQSLATLDLVEGLRDLQRAEEGRVEVFGVWTEAYRWLAGHLLRRAADGGAREDLALGWRTAERMRARELRETRETEATEPVEAGEAEPEERLEVLRRIVAVQRRLLDPQLEGEDRGAAAAELEVLERREAESRPPASPVPRPRPEKRGFAALEEIETALAADEALLAFQTGYWENIYGRFDGGSWLVASSQRGSRVVRLPGRQRLEAAVRAFSRSFGPGGTGPPPGLAESLFDALLAEALDALPPEIHRLVLIPDRALYRLPFAALGRAGEPPLAAGYRLSVAPSATLWLGWRRSAVEPPGAALALADPLPVHAEAAPAAERGWALADPSSLGPLPYARREGRAVVCSLGSSSLLLTGAEAAEARLESLDLSGFGILHFAAHAVLDEQHPRRSAVVLAPGADDEDGLLQPREIARLDLDGKVVVLSACQGASGAVVEGEGPLSLARAFFAAGAQTVVASLWPLRDDEAADLFRDFYRHLAAGASVETALAAAQEEARRRGAEPETWAGVAVFGRGDAVPVPGGRAGWYARGGWPFFLLVLLMLCGLFALLRRIARR
jgi:hypothetical protein